MSWSGNLSAAEDEAGSSFVRIDREFRKRVKIKGFNHRRRELWFDIGGRCEAAQAQFRKTGVLGEDYPAQETLADELGKSKRTIQRDLDWLEENGWLEIDHRDQPESNRYRVLIPAVVYRLMGEGFTIARGALQSELAKIPMPSARGRRQSVMASECRVQQDILSEGSDILSGPMASECHPNRTPENRTLKEKGEKAPARFYDSVSARGERPTSLPRDFQLSPETRAYALRNRVDPAGQLEPFKNKAIAEGWTQTGDRGWQAKFRVWVDTEVRYGRGNFRPPPPNIRDLDRDHISVDPEKAKRARGIVADTLKKMGAAA